MGLAKAIKRGASALPVSYTHLRHRLYRCRMREKAHSDHTSGITGSLKQ